MNEVVTRWLAPDLQLAPALPEPDYEEPAMLEPVLRPPTLEAIQAIEDAAQHEGFARGRLAREAVKADSKRVAQVVKGWVASEA